MSEAALTKIQKDVSLLPLSFPFPHDALTAPSLC